MTNIKATSTLGVFFSFVLVLSCSSLDKIIKDPKASLAKTLNQSALKKTDKEMILSKIEKIPAPEKEKLIAFSKTNHGKTISELYSTDYIDSLKNILKTTGTLKVNSFESFLIDFLKLTTQKILFTLPILTCLLRKMVRLKVLFMMLKWMKRFFMK